MNEKKVDIVKPASVRSATTRLGTPSPNGARGDPLFVEEADRDEINSRIRLFKSRTVQSKTRPVSVSHSEWDDLLLSTCNLLFLRSLLLVKISLLKNHIFYVRF